MTAAHEDLLRFTMSWIAVVLVTCIAVIFFWIIVRRGLQERAWLETTKHNFAAIVGLPAIAVAALFLVLVLRMADGPIEVTIGNSLAFKGAAAPIVFWVVCFLAMASALKMLWRFDIPNHPKNEDGHQG
jgi:hypothetical protein